MVTKRLGITWANVYRPASATSNITAVLGVSSATLPTVVNTVHICGAALPRASQGPSISLYETGGFSTTMELMK